MFKCYQCDTKRRERERVFNNMNLCHACHEKHRAIPHPTHPFLCIQPPQWVLDSIEAETNPALAKRMQG